ncbi:MAG: hypothetical protein H6752_17885 [Candidatus Omnitrophica bacterium]|nr:hypothetical protein [Candidatus Omnitrophota bacterium]
MIRSKICLIFGALMGICLNLSHGLDMSGNYSVRGAAEYAGQLLEGGSEKEIELATEALDAVLSHQETREGAAHRGNFLWNRDSKVIQDLNAVEFTLTHLIPLAIKHRDLLPEDLRSRLLEGIRLGLEEIARLDVALTYTNIASMDCCNTCLGGELLGDKKIAERGYDRFRRFFDLVAENGTIFEFNSPGYSRVTLHALHTLREHVQDPKTRLRARLLADRLGLGLALRIHPEVGRLAGPYSRAYHRTLIYSTTPYAEILADWIDKGVISEWVGKIAERESPIGEIRETAIADWKLGLTTFMGRSFSMGLASREVSRQTNPLVIQVERHEKETTGLVCSRYLIDDFESDSFFDQGKFFGVQEGARAIAVYAPRGAESPDSFAPASRHQFGNAKAALVWLESSNVGKIWTEHGEIESLPFDLDLSQTLVVETGPVFIGIKPLARTELGHDSPIRLEKREGRLYFEIHNYLGPEKVFWELDRGSRFYQGQPFCAFYVEVAESSDYANGLEFLREIDQTDFTREIEQPFTSYRDDAERKLRLEATRDGIPLGLEVDLMKWELKSRWTWRGVETWPMLESPWAVQSASGKIEVASATVTCPDQPALLVGNPEKRTWAVQYYGKPGPLTFEVPTGSVSFDRMTPGWILWDRGEVTVEAMEGWEGPTLVGGRLEKND